MTDAELLAMVEPMRDPSIWEKSAPGQWQVKDHVGNHINDAGVGKARLSQVGIWQPYNPTPPEVSIKRQEDGRQSDYVLL
jgi:hypothetical protein